MKICRHLAGVLLVATCSNVRIFPLIQTQTDCYVVMFIYSLSLQVAMAFLVTSNCKPLFHSSRQARVCTKSKIQMGLFDGMFGSKEKTQSDILDQNFQVRFFPFITFAVTPE